MTLTEKQINELTDAFKNADKVRLLHGPDDKESSLLFGVMQGMRETLESKGFEVPGVTGFWWYESLGEEPKRGPNIEELVRKNGTDGDMVYVLQGRESGEKKTLEILNSK
ncbi:hypothetical protein [Bacillus thuringiensis]|uniref:hypothetical protein n=1 Tax=Bacillus thuringiensis TaxID=1428 RepID=UPI0021D66D41|nr:hypothetical protein [Bacillus thuringiensis]MCU7667877.1 hypothetical protein [Bacillus thuringiensis]